MLNIIQEKIKHAFSDASMQYSMLTSLHKDIGRDLIKKIKDVENVSTVLDIGMGTGWLTNRLTHYFPGSQVVGIDFSPGMVRAARQEFETFTIINADAMALPIKKASMDVVVSNLAFQWLADLPLAFNGCHQVLKEGGTFCFSIFTRETLWELFESIENSLESEKGSIKRLASQVVVVDAVKNVGFKDVEFEVERIRVRFPDAMALIKWIKDIGANALERDFFVGKDLLQKVQKYYDAKFSDHLGIYATFEVVWVKAKKR